MSKKKIESFQFLRALCALCVFFNHVPFLHNIVNGQAGVALFMMIGGFFAMLSTESRSKKIFIKKLIKIVPLYWGLTIVLFIVAKFYPSILNNTNPTCENLIKSLFFIPFEVPGVGHKPIINVGWYLNIDIIFTIIFSISMKISHKKRGIIASMIILISFLIGQLFNFNNFIIDVYTRFYIIYYFAGILMYYIYTFFLNKFVLKKSYNQIIIVMIFIPYCLLFKYNYLFVIYSIIIFIYILLMRDCNIQKYILNIGNYSFAIYLIHYFVIGFISRLIYSLENISFISILVSCLCFILTYLISKFITKYLNIFSTLLLNFLKKNKINV